MTWIPESVSLESDADELSPGVIQVASFAARLTEIPNDQLGVFGDLEPNPAYNSGSRASFLLRETHNEILTPGRVNTLSTTRDNIHYFQASSQGARGIDITTGFGGDGTFSFIDFEPDKPKDARERLFEAVWIGSKL